MLKELSDLGERKAVTPRILTYDDLAKRLPGQSKEELVDVKLYDDRIVAEYDKADMEDYTGSTILVRRRVAKKLAAVNATLAKRGYNLKIVYGYRHPEVQRSYFEHWKQVIGQSRPDLSSDALDSYTHNFIAVPDVAGHPTGGAVDVTLVDQNGEELDMGNSIADYSDEDKIRTFSGKLTKTQQDNRSLLLEAMASKGFAPFYGEWWHFSYGDREWAAFYKKERALYGTVNLKSSGL